jgi:hypothetical protein
MIRRRDRRDDLVANSSFPNAWCETTRISLRVARFGLPVIIPVAVFRDKTASA